ncbi:hypothetical protein VFPBJ_05326 [Purpureocillium lilacinum]|uniref:DUF7587 domain-containing protein n=1 Tax=Purpureocillium lilacinum TaxID=33203 RepID=A0A179GR31_PURLI|nr:hypothetical protein VFPBJ_05326 [Purpureocillium lilacinum]
MSTQKPEPLDADTVRELLYPEAGGGDPAECEERRHPWLTPEQQAPTDRPLLRLWDKNSGSQPDEKGRMLARAPRQRLCTRKSRRTSLGYHIDHGNWDVETPYISFSSSPEAIKKLAWHRDTYGVNRGPHELIAINPGVRRAKGLPLLDVGAEMEHYGIEDPYDDSDYYENHYACLWEVTPEEIVRKWEWDELMKSNEKDWYEEIVLPAFQQHDDDFPLNHYASIFLNRLNEAAGLPFGPDESAYYSDAASSSDGYVSLPHGGYETSGWGEPTQPTALLELLRELGGTS